MSKGLKALEEIVNYAIGNFTDNESKYQKDLEIIKKELKALEIIKAIGVFIVFQDFDGKYHLETIVDNVGLMKKEYELLKEVSL